MKTDSLNNIIQIANNVHADIWHLARHIGEHPEEGYKEYASSSLLAAFLEKQGFVVEKPLVGMDTAFRARFTGTLPGKTSAFLAEYDALVDIGHGCGHNLIGAASVGAAVVLSQQANLPGNIVVIGCPAEETSGAKVPLTEAGVFQDIDAVMMFHPGSCNVPEIASLALDAIEVSFYGRATHMAISDSVGINALDGLLSLFQKVAKLKKKLARDERIDGIIIQGGKSPNIVPEHAVARFYLRAAEKGKLARLREKFLNSATKSAQESRTQMDWRFYEHSYDPMKTSRPLAQSFRDNLLKLGISDIEPPQLMLGSVDMGNVSQVVPALHAYLRLGTGSEMPHSLEFAKAAVSEEGEQVLSLAVKTLALTGWDFLTNERLQQKVIT